MLSVEQALEVILDHTNILETENLPVLKAAGQISSEDVYAHIDVPSFNSSARDGLAVISSDVRGASRATPRVLRVIGTTAAGYVPRRKVIPGTAIRIMTGAPIPEGADSVISFEDTDQGQRISSDKKYSEVRIFKEEKRGANINPAGYQIKKGEMVLARGKTISPAVAGITASLGITRLNVIRRPVVAIISTGEELTNPGTPLRKAKIYSGNAISIAAQVKRYGGVPQIMGIARDNRDSLIRKISNSANADMVITTGGVAGGDRDIVVDTLGSLGKVLFHGLRMTPGKSTAFALLELKDKSGRVREVPHFALSGNPSATMTGMEILVRPALHKMLGREENKADIIEAFSEVDIVNSPGKRRFTWVRIELVNGVYQAWPTALDSGGIMQTIASADGLGVIPEDSTGIKKGDKLQVILLNWL